MTETLTTTYNVAEDSSLSSLESYETIGDFWLAALSRLEEEIPASRYRGLILCLTPLNESTFSHMVLGTSNEFSRNFTESTCREPIERILSELSGQPVTISLVTDETLAQRAVNPPKLKVEDVTDFIKKERPALTSNEASDFDPKYTFESFVVGDQNGFARNAALAVAENPGLKSGFNPLFIWGPSGLGKTHLLQAIGAYIKENFPEKVVRYATSEEFMNQYINASQSNDKVFDTESFRNRYRKSDVLLIDDIQFLEKKFSTIEQLYFTIDYLKRLGKQIVIAADRSPLELDMDERYTSRFASGLQVDIQPPRYETRRAIIMKYLESEHIAFNKDAIDYIADRSSGNIREMEGALTRIIAFAELTHKTFVDRDLAEKVAKDLFNEKIDKPISIAMIQSEVCRYFSINNSDLLGKKRKQEIVFPRHIAMYLCQELTDSSFPQIGRAFGGKDHTTVMHAVSKIKEKMSSDSNIYQQVQQITNNIKVKNQ